MHGVVGGTFNLLHKGHKALLSHTSRVSSFVHVGVTSQDMASTKRAAVRPYDERAKDVALFLDSLRSPDTYDIMQIEDAVGFAAEPGLNILVASRETKEGALAVNQKRVEKGLPPLRIHVLGMVMADDGLPLSSSRILEGGVDKDGHLDRPLKVAISTDSPAKTRGVQKAFERMLAPVVMENFEDKLEAMQPMGFEETREYAKRRARSALKNRVDFAVGVENGIMENGMEVHVCAILNAKGEETLGQSPGFLLPKWVLEAPEDGRSISHEMKRMLGTSKIDGEMVELFSGKKVTAEDFVEQSAMAALIPWFGSEIYGLEEM